MDGQIIAALVGLGVTVIGALGTIVKLLTDRLQDELSRNTQITKEARAAANGHLVEILDELAAERNRVLGLRAIVRERDDRLQYIISRYPEVERSLSTYKRRRSYVYSVDEEEQAISDLLNVEAPSSAPEP